ncbi:hypothetical protein U1Q18_016065 [Sarracenia purpurea var. burkii]
MTSVLLAVTKGKSATRDGLAVNARRRDALESEVARDGLVIGHNWSSCLVSLNWLIRFAEPTDLVGEFGSFGCRVWVP